MKAFIVLVCGVLVLVNCQNSDVIVIGSKYIRPRQPYTVAFANPLTSNVKLNLSLRCEGETGFEQKKSLQLSRQTGKSVSFDVPDIEDTQCYFSAVNDGGRVNVNHNVDLLFPKKTLSMFILPDKPIFKPGEILRFRVVVVDIALKPAKHINTIEINIEDANSQSRRQWKQAKLHNGIFETTYQLPSNPTLGMWTITVTADDSNVINEKSHQFEVREYVLPKFVVKVAPSHTLLISDREVNLTVTSHYTFGEPVRGNITVELFTNSKLIRNATHSAINQAFDSTASFTFKLKKLLDQPEEDEDGNTMSYVMVRANVSVTEEFSKFTTKVSKEIPVFVHPYKIALIKPAKNYRPGADYFCKLSVRHHNGIPVEPKGRSITLKTDLHELTEPLNKQGVATFTLSMPEESENLDISAEFEGFEYNNIAVIEGSESTSNQYLRVHTKERIIVGKSVTFTVNSNDHFTQLSYFIVSRGSIVSTGHLKLNKRKTYSLKLKLSISMAPRAKLIVVTIDDGQLIMDSIEMDFESFANDFEYMLDDTTYRPDQDVYVDVSAEKDSFVAFQAVDQGALLLGHEEFGLTKEHILQDLDEYMEDALHSTDIIHSFGLFSRLGETSNDESSRVRRAVQRTYKKAVFLRIDFPESWLWENFTMNNKATLTLTKLAPATITSWYVTGFALSPSRGLGVMSSPREFTVSKPFYMIANLPYSIKRGEVVRVQVTLFNFLGTSLTTDVTLFNKNDEIEFVDKTSNDTKRRNKAIVVRSHQAESIAFLIKAKKLGEIAIKIEGVNQLASDGLEHMLRVVPESRHFEIDASRFIELGSYGNQNFSLKCDIPREADPGSTKIQVIIDPPLIASTADSLESLLVLPTGSADLNLRTFIPNVVVLEYLAGTETVAPDIKQKALNYLSVGYANQLKYRDSSGSFSQWGHEKGNASVFLTALVANAFIMTSSHITVDQKVITDAFTWISGKQKSDGCFQENGEVIYAPMQDQSSYVALTAFIVAAVRENSKVYSQFGSLVEKGVKCLVKNFDSLTEIHDIAVATYALSLTNDANKKKYLDRLIRDSDKDESGRHWNGELNVEVAGYALMAYLAQNNTIDSLPIMRWLNSQRYSTGQFSGVQSTFVALKALGKMATQIAVGKNDYRVQISYGRHTKTYDVSNLKPMESIKHDLPDAERLFKFTIDGVGYGFLQLSCQCHTSIEIEKHHTFILNVEVQSTSTYYVQHLHVCLAFKQREAYNVSGTTLVEVHLPSGLEVNENAVQDYSRQIKNTERAHGNTAMLIYYSALTDMNQVCFKVTAHRKFKIAMHRPSYVVVYDVNNKKHYAVKSYQGKVMQACDICDGEDCESMNC